MSSKETNSKSHERENPPPSQPVAEEGFVRIGGNPQWLTIRGADRRNPVLLILTGPGAAFSRYRLLFASWERRFTLVQWDQPGAGATFERNGPELGALSIERLVRDGIEVVEHVCSGLDTRKVALLCLSGGTIVGLRIAKARPDLISAYAGSGQIVDWARQDALSYALLREQAEARRDTAASMELATIGPPPYADTATDAIKSRYAGAMTSAEAAALAALDPTVLAELSAVPMEQLRARATAVYDALRPEIVAFDGRRLGRNFDVPMFFFQGEQDLFTVTSEVRAYAEWLEAPVKRFVELKGAGHSTFLMPHELLRLLDLYVWPVVTDSSA
jgi:pimeloyl-ACP methyl ester carboxylesterase